MFFTALSTAFQVCFFRKKPQDFPYSITLLFVFIAFILGFVAMTVPIEPVSQLLIMHVLVFTIGALGLFLLLKLNKKTNRFVQILSAIVAVNFSFKCFMAILIATSLFVGGILYLFFFWELAVYVYILAHGLDYRYPQAAVAMIALAFFIFVLFGVFSPLFLSQEFMNQIIQVDPTAIKQA